MTNSTYNTRLDTQDLTKRLLSIKKSSSIANDGDYVSRLPTMSRRAPTSPDSPLSSLPAFRKSTTTSTTESSDSVSRLEVIRSVPSTKCQRESVEIGVGEFSKPRLRRRRASNESAKSQKEFQYYGRHANSWLFNDFSITDSVKKGFGKVFSGKQSGGDEGKKF